MDRPSGTLAEELAVPTESAGGAAAPDSHRGLARAALSIVLALSLAMAVWGGVWAVGDSALWAKPAAAGAKARTVVGPPRLIRTAAASYTVPGAAPRLAWPGRGQAAAEVEGIGSLGSSGPVNTAVPIASVTKTMTAFLILSDHPLAPGGSGPTLTISAQEAADYETDVKEGQSVVKVSAGEKLTERQALEALMLSSADNIARVLAQWDAGSIPAFLTKMNAAAARLGMAHTRYTDPSGLAASTVSTAPDQVKIGQAAMALPAFRQIVAERSATIPVAGLIVNFDALLGRDGVIGIKTGSTSKAGGCLLFAATVQVGGATETIIGAVLGQGLPSGKSFLTPTMLAADALIRSVDAAMAQQTVTTSQTELALIRRSGAPDEAMSVLFPVTVPGWSGLSYRLSIVGPPLDAMLEVIPEGTDTPAATARLTPLPQRTSGPRPLA